MINSVNLFSLISISDPIVLHENLKYLSVEIKDEELETLRAFCEEFKKHTNNISLCNNFYIGFKIPQIPKQLDLLRVDANMVINIELKRQFTDKVYNQLKRNKYYLQFLGKSISLYTYCVRENKLYLLDEREQLIESDFEHLIKDLQHIKNLFNGDLTDLFNPSDYLVSPFNSTEQFLNSEYFLTSQQEEIANNIINRVSTENLIITIKGIAGTGKSLLLYDIAKKFQGRGNNILIIHGGNLNPGHLNLKAHGWNIMPIKSLSYILKNSRSSIILIDEAQRLKVEQVKMLLDFAKKNKSVCVFCYDPKQTLCSSEEYANIAKILEESASVRYELTDKIRTNKALADFLNVILGRKKEKIAKCKNSEIVYFQDIKDAACYIKNKTQNGWTYISHTPSIDIYRRANKYDALLGLNEIGTAHEVIGQEFDNVIAVIDDTFYYDENGMLKSRGITSNPYLRRNMFFQAITRVRRSIEIVIIDNLSVYMTLLQSFL